MPPTVPMHTFPTGDADNAAWLEWCEHLRPTSLVPANVKANDLPLRVVCCKHIEEHGPFHIRTIKPLDWNFAAISHKWLNNEPWTEIDKRPYPAAGEVKVTAVARESLVALARLCISIGIDYFWLDCLCIDQESALEQAREILNMGKYYAKACKTLIFPYGLDNVGPPLLENGDAPVWHKRAWTLQEEAMAGSAAVFVLYFSESEDIEFGSRHEQMSLCDLGDDGRLQKFANFRPDAESVKKKEPRSYLRLVPGRDMTSCRMAYATMRLADGSVRDKAFKVTFSMESQKDWTLWSALREMYRRESSREEDLVYGILGLLGITIQPDLVKYGIRLRGALRLLVDAVHVDQRLLLTVVESYHGNFIDGYCSLPAFQDRTAVPAARLDHLRTLGVAQFEGHSGMVVTAPAITVDLVEQLDDSSELNEAAGILKLQLVDSLEEEGEMNVWSFSQAGSEKRRESKGLARIAPNALRNDVTLIAATQVQPPATSSTTGELNPFYKQSTSTPLITFCCLVCVNGGSVKHKVGLALVVASKHRWRIERHLVA
jgi:hypothetical protein